ncbi:MAG: hypothetical protein ACRCYX_05415 [Dermatophilaceae bacterium]
MIGAIRSEIRKVFTTRLWWGLALGMVLLAFGISMGAAALVGLDDGGFEPGPATAQLVYTSGLLGNFGALTALFPLALGVLLITSEFRHKTVSATYLAAPRRAVVAVAKFIAVVAVGAVYGIVHVGASVAGGALILAAVKDTPLFLGDGDVLQSLGMSVVATIVWALLGFGFGMLVRNQIAATMVAVAFGFLGQLVLNIVFGIMEWWTAMKYIPGNLTTQMLVTSDPSGGSSEGAPEFIPFAWWVSALILVGYSAVLTVVGSWLTARRDIT